MNVRGRNLRDKEEESAASSEGTYGDISTLVYEAALRETVARVRAFELTNEERQIEKQKQSV